MKCQMRRQMRRCLSGIGILIVALAPLAGLAESRTNKIVEIKKAIPLSNGGYILKTSNGDVGIMCSISAQNSAWHAMNTYIAHVNQLTFHKSGEKIKFSSDKDCYEAMKAVSDSRVKTSIVYSSDTNSILEVRTTFAATAR